MFCRNCGSKIREGANFCPVCGRATKASPTTKNDDTTSVQETSEAGGRAEGNANPELPTKPSESEELVTDNPPHTEQEGDSGEAAANPRESGEKSEGASQAEGSPQATISKCAETEGPSQGSLEDAVRSTRNRSRRKIPLVLIIILVTLGIAGAAFAATYIYQRYFSPAAKAEQAAVEEEQRAAEEEQEREDRLEQSKALYNDVLSDYQSTQANSWNYDSGDAEQPWSEDLTMLSQFEQMGSIPFYATDLSGWEIKYAYTDLGEDGIQDLVIALVQQNAEETDYTVIGIFTSDGRSVYSAIDGMIGARDWWSIMPGGLVYEYGSGGSEIGGCYTYTVVEGQLSLVDELSMERDRIPKCLHNGEEISEDEYNALATANRTQAALEWTSLADFTPIQAEATEWMDAETSKRFAAFASKCEDYISDYGEATVSSMTNEYGVAYDYYSGLGLAKLIDFDGDGSSELLLVYYDGSGFNTEVWRFSDGSLTKSYEYKGASGASDADANVCLVISSYNDAPTLYEYVDDTSTYTSTGYQLKGDTFEAVVTAVRPSGNGFSNDATLTVNGDSVSSEDYSAALGTAKTEYKLKWLSDSSVYSYNGAVQYDAREETSKTLHQLGVTS